jgi:disulfide bond formation protein DsbB
MRPIAGLPLTARLAFTAGFLVCAGLIGFAYYLQYFEGQDPCPLCIVQRVLFFALAVLFLIAALHGPARTGAMVYGGLLTVTAGLGAAVAARHVWLQYLPPDRVPECGPGLDYLLRKYSGPEVLARILKGSGECAESGWSLLGLSIAGWSLVWFVLLAAYAVWLTLAARSRR